MKSIHAFLFLVFLLLTGCISAPTANKEPVPTVHPREEVRPPVAAAPPPPAPPVVVTSPAPMSIPDRGSNVLYRDYLISKEKFPRTPFNLIVFPKKAVTKADKEKYLFMCELWMASYSTYQEQTWESDMNAVPFFWMLTKKTSEENCEQLLTNYDYARARSYLTKNKLDLSKIYLVCQLPQALVTMDMSRLKKEEDLEMAYGVWTDKLRVFPKDSKEIKPYDLVRSAKAVLGAFGVLIAMK